LTTGGHGPTNSDRWTSLTTGGHHRTAGNQVGVIVGVSQPGRGVRFYRRCVRLCPPHFRLCPPSSAFFSLLSAFRLHPPSRDLGGLVFSRCVPPGPRFRPPFKGSRRYGVVRPFPAASAFLSDCSPLGAVPTRPSGARSRLPDISPRRFRRACRDRGRGAAAWADRAASEMRLPG